MKFNKFSLIEFLLIVVVLTLLASLLQPSLKKIIYQSQDMKCKHNLKTLIQGVAGYTFDYDDQLPLMETYGGGHYIHDTAYYHEIADYVGYTDQVFPLIPRGRANQNKHIFHTALEGNGPPPPEVLQCPTKENSQLIGYAYNSYGGGTFQSTGRHTTNLLRDYNWQTGKLIRTAERSIQKMFLIGCNRDGTTGGRHLILAHRFYPHTYSNRHLGGLNIALGDNSVEFKLHQEMSRVNRGGILDNEEEYLLWRGIY